MEKIKKVGLYIRVSTEEQARHGYSIESQKARLKEYAGEKGYAIHDYYIDEGKSARSKLSNRKELLRLLDDVKLYKIDRIIIWRLDRWFRNIKDYYKVQDILDKYKVDWECTDEDYNTSTSNGRLYLNIKLSIAQNESDQTSDRIKFNFANMVRNKRPITGSLPVGYKIVGEKQNKRIVKDEEKENYVIDMFNIFEKTLSIRKTNMFLLEKYPEYSLTYEHLKSHLKNTMYYGCYRDIENYCPSYITKEKHDKIVSLIKKNQKVYQHNNHVYLFSGLLKCKECGKRMGGSYLKRVHKDGTVIHFGTYKCGYHYLDGSCSNNHTTSEDKLENWLINNFVSKLNEYVIHVNEIKSKMPKIDIAKKKKDLQGKLDRLNELYLEGRITKEKYDKEYNIIKVKLNELSKNKNEELIANLDKYKGVLENNDILDIYNKLTRENKRRYWYEYIDYIIQDDEEEYKVFFK